MGARLSKGAGAVAKGTVEQQKVLGQKFDPKAPGSGAVQGLSSSLARKGAARLEAKRAKVFGQEDAKLVRDAREGELDPARVKGVSRRGRSVGSEQLLSVSPAFRGLEQRYKESRSPDEGVGEQGGLYPQPSTATPTYEAVLECIKDQNIVGLARLREQARQARATNALHAFEDPDKQHAPALQRPPIRPPEWEQGSIQPEEAGDPSMSGAAPETQPRTPTAPVDPKTPAPKDKGDRVAQQASLIDAAIKSSQSRLPKPQKTNLSTLDPNAEQPSETVEGDTVGKVEVVGGKGGRRRVTYDPNDTDLPDPHTPKLRSLNIQGMAAGASGVRPKRMTISGAKIQPGHVKTFGPADPELVRALRLTEEEATDRLRAGVWHELIRQYSDRLRDNKDEGALAFKSIRKAHPSIPSNALANVLKYFGAVDHGNAQQANKHAARVLGRSTKGGELPEGINVGGRTKVSKFSSEVAERDIRENRVNWFATPAPNAPMTHVMDSAPKEGREAPDGDRTTTSPGAEGSSVKLE